MDRILQQLPEFFSANNIWFLVEAMGLTLALTGIGCGLGFLLAFFVVYVRQTPGNWALPLRAAAILFVESMRRIPFLVTIYLVLFFIVILTNNPSLFVIALEALQLARDLHPDMILMDVRMPVCNGLEATRLIKTELPEIRIVMLTASAEHADLFEALKSGASGYLLKNLKPNVLFDYLAGVARGEAPISRELSAYLLREFAQQANDLEKQKHIIEEKRLERGNSGVDHRFEMQPEVMLTNRQLQILEMVAAGLSYKEVGVILHLSENTVKYHMGGIVRRLLDAGMATRFELPATTRIAPGTTDSTAAFLATGITVLGFLVFGRSWWGPMLVIGSIVLLTLLLAPEAYVAIGFAFVLILITALGVMVRDRSRAPGGTAHRLAAPTR